MNSWSMTVSKKVALVLVLSVMLASFGASAFAPPRMNPPAPRRTALYMGKGLNKARNKQAELARKMELAKQQKQQEEGVAPAEESAKKTLSDEEIKKQNDQKRFEQLLKQTSTNVLSAYQKDGYLTKEQEEAEIDAARAGVERLFEGDPAGWGPFEQLVDVRTEHAICKKGATKVVPWIRKIPSNDYLIVLTDPRVQSLELRDTVKALSASLPPNMRDKMIVINADSPAETRRWLKKNEGVSLPIYSDEKLGWMREYTALGEKRLSMSMFILANGRIQKLVRELDGVLASRVIQNAVKSLDIQEEYS